MQSEKRKPGKLAEFLLSIIANPDDQPGILGDFEEMFRETAGEQGIIKARLWYWKQILISIPGFVTNSFYWRFIMFRNYFKIAVRNLSKHKTFSFITIPEEGSFGDILHI